MWKKQDPEGAPDDIIAGEGQTDRGAFVWLSYAVTSQELNKGKWDFLGEDSVSKDVKFTAREFEDLHKQS